MAPVWYFARDDEERGPFTESQMRTLVTAGKLRTDDLVWQEGTDDWVAAEEAFEFQADSGEGPIPSRRDSPVRQPLDIQEPPPAPAAPPLSSVTHESGRTARAIAYLLIAIGFLGVLASKGFESLTARNVKRLEAIVALQQSQFEATWKQQIAKLEAEQRELQTTAVTNASTHRRLNEIDNQLRQLAANREAKRRELEQGVWSDQRSHAEEAEQHEKIWSFWRQLGFLGATAVFCAGLLVMGLIGETAERSISLLIMGVIAYSLFVGGTAWS